MKKVDNMENTFERYLSTVEDDYVTPQYVADIDGRLHDITGNIEHKLSSVEQSYKYWEMKLVESPDSYSANRFYLKFKHLYKQIQLLLESDNIVAHA